MSPSPGGGAGAASGDPLRFFFGLKDRDLRREGVVVGEGRLVASRVAARLPLLAVLAEPSAAAEAETLAAGRCPVAVLPSEELSRTAGYPFHRGLLAAARRPELPEVSPAGLAEFRRVLVLPEPNDPENLGAVVRSAAALGWDAVVLGPGSCDPYGSRALRCSMGAVLTLPLFAAPGPNAIGALAAEGWAVAAAELSPGATELGTDGAAGLLRGAARLALMLGNEHDGIPEPWRACRTASVSIPQARNTAVDSLNVAAAAAILLWEGR